MHRRAYLTGLAGSLVLTGGCLSSTAEPSRGTERTISVVKATATGLTVGAEVRQASPTSEQPATVRLTWENGGETPVELGIGSGDWYEPLFSYTLNNGTPEATGLVLVPPHYEKQKRSGSCWNPPEGDYWGGSGAPEMTTLQPGESFHNDYEVWTDLDVSGCLPPGEYDFGQFREGVTPTWRVSLSVRQ